jgi:hypothetical protein
MNIAIFKYQLPELAHDCSTSFLSDYLDLALTFRLFLLSLLTLFFLHLSLIFNDN